VEIVERAWLPIHFWNFTILGVPHEESEPYVRHENAAHGWGLAIVSGPLILIIVNRFLSAAASIWVSGAKKVTLRAESYRYRYEIVVRAKPEAIACLLSG
jgi:hypothetical protein